MDPDPDYDPEPAGQSEYDAWWGTGGGSAARSPHTDAEIADMARRAGLDAPPFGETHTPLDAALDESRPAGPAPKPVRVRRGRRGGGGRRNPAG